jgi:IPT/TIG domain
VPAAVTVNASGDTVLSCVTPAWPTDSAVSVSVSANGVDFSESVGSSSSSSTGGTQFVYYRQPSLIAVAPNCGSEAGGAVLKLRAYGLRPTGQQLLCRFTHTATGAVETVPGTVLSSEEARCVAPALPHGAARIHLSLNGADFGTNAINNSSSAVGLLYTYRVRPTIISNGPVPAAGFSVGGTALELTGTNFGSFGPAVACRFTATSGASQLPLLPLVPAAVLSDSRILCTAPRLALEATATAAAVALALVPGDGSADLAAGSYTYLPTPLVASAAPSGGPLSGGTRISVRGQGFGALTASDQLLCHFATSSSSSSGDSSVLSSKGTATPAVLVPATTSADGSSSSSIECSTPARGAPGAVQLRISVNGALLLPGAAPRFLYTAAALQVASVSPATGPAAGGTVLIVTGSGFVNSGSLVCSFSRATTAASGGGATVLGITSASYLSPRALRCAVPALDLLLSGGSFAVSVAVSNDGAQFSAGVRAFRYHAPPTVDRAAPASGALAGGTPVHISGRDLGAAAAAATGGLECHFGTASAVLATVLNDTAVICVAPPAAGVAAGSAVRLQLTANGGSELIPSSSGSSVLSFVYRNAPIVTAVQPQLVLSGRPVELTVSGTGFSEAEEGALACRLSAGGRVTLVTAKFVSETAVRCAAAVPAGAAPFSVQVTNNGVDYDPHSGVSVAVTVQPFIMGVSPLTGPASGGTVLTVTGLPFQDVPGLVCVFTLQYSNTTDSSSSSSDSTVVVPARWLSSTQLQCPAPRARSGAAAAAVAVSLNDGVQSSEPALALFRYLPAAAVYAVVPAFGTASSSSSSISSSTSEALEVVVTGTGFSDSPELSCQFGAAAEPVPARYINATAVACVPSAEGSLLAAATEAVAVTVRVALTAGDYTTSSAVFTFVPAAVVLAAAPAAGPLSGGTVVTVTGSGFMDTPALACRFGSTTVPAVLLAKTQLSCVAPPAQGQGAVVLSISNNGAEWSTAAIATASASKYRYYAQAIVEGVSPAAVTELTAAALASGSESSDAVVLISGGFFMDSAVLACRFADVIVPGNPSYCYILCAYYLRSCSCS